MLIDILYKLKNRRGYMKNIFFNQCQEFLTVHELSKKIFVSKKTIYRMIATKKVKSLKIGGIYLIKTSSVKTLFEEV